MFNIQVYSDTEMGTVRKPMKKSVQAHDREKLVSYVGE